MILSTHTHAQLGLWLLCLGGDTCCGAGGQTRRRGEGPSQTAGEQGKGVRNNRNDQAACCSTGNGERGRGGVGASHRGPVRQTAIQSETALPRPAFCLCWATALSMRSEKADHLSRRVQGKITAPYKEQKGLMFVKAQQQHGRCVFTRLSCCLIECITGLRPQKITRNHSVHCKQREARNAQSQS